MLRTIIWNALVAMNLDKKEVYMSKFYRQHLLALKHLEANFDGDWNFGGNYKFQEFGLDINQYALLCAKLMRFHALSVEEVKKAIGKEIKKLDKSHN